MSEEKKNRGFNENDQLANDTLRKENSELREYIKDLNHLMMTLHDKNNMLEEKLESSNRKHH